MLVNNSSKKGGMWFKDAFARSEVGWLEKEKVRRGKIIALGAGCRTCHR